MRNLSTNRSNLSNENIDILKRIVFDEDSVKEEVVADDFDNVDIEQEVHDNALGLLYKSLNDNKHQRKPMVYFFVGLIIGAVSVLFLSAILLVSDKDSIENDVKTVKENIIDTEKQVVNSSEKKDSLSLINNEEEVDENGSRVYTVKEGDTLGGIVNRLYGERSSYSPEKVERFKEANGLKSIHVLKIGQKLIIPD